MEAWSCHPSLLFVCELDFRLRLQKVYVHIYCIIIDLKVLMLMNLQIANLINLRPRYNAIFSYYIVAI